MKKLVIPCFLFMVTVLSLIIAISLILIVTSANYSTNDFSFTTVLLGLLCSISIFYISIFINISVLMKPKYPNQFELNDSYEKNAI